MESDNPILIPAFLLFLLIVITPSSSSSSTFPIAKPGCEDRCGNVSIPYPFGTKEGCYLNEEFFINCSNSGKPFLPGNTVNVRDIYTEGQLRVSYNVGYDCYYSENNDYIDQYMNLSGVFTFNSSVNMLTTIGCDTYSVVRGQTYEGSSYMTGCISVCDPKGNIPNDSCAGIGCCQTSITNGLWQINTSLYSFDNHSYTRNFNPCSFGFLVEKEAFNFFAENLTNINKDLSVPVVVDWVVESNVSCTEAKMNLISFACTSENSECYDQEKARGYRCKCKDGFEGNPYLPSNGCQDIDECANPDLCFSHSTCYNTWGSYKCICNQGYQGRSDIDKGCIADAPPQQKPYWLIYAGTVVGSCTIVVVLCYFWYSRLMTRKEDNLREEYFRKNGGFLLQEKLTASQREASSYSVKIFTVEELQNATSDFDDSQIIGRGGFGTVYKGELIDKTIVAIKRSRGVDLSEVEQFINEVILLSRINNRNVVKLFGCCLETEVPLLVYEFIDNGTLFEHLQGMIKNHVSKLSWKIRMRIASQVAGVLFYLHSCASPQIIHRDIKSSNILLEKDYTAKVADFGISRLVPMNENKFSTMVQGTPGYLDPEYMQTALLTEKSDVYSFGIVLIELLTGKKVFSTDRPEEERFLANHFLHVLKCDDLAGVLDHNMDYNIETFEQIKEVALIAKRCIALKGDDRPCMKEVSRELEALEMKGHKYAFNALEIDSKECELLVCKKHSGAYASNDGDPSTYTSCDLSPVTPSTIEHMLPIASGR